jgi:hypothetical protein
MTDVSLFRLYALRAGYQYLTRPGDRWKSIALHHRHAG